MLSAPSCGECGEPDESRVGIRSRLRFDQGSVLLRSNKITQDQNWLLSGPGRVSTVGYWPIWH
jgi:hypothetical protein